MSEWKVTASHRSRAAVIYLLTEQQGRYRSSAG